MGAEFKQVKPRNGVIVRYPRTFAILPVVGATVPWIGPDGRYWRRRMAAGDIEEISESKTAVEVSETKSKSKKEENK